MTLRWDRLALSGCTFALAAVLGNASAWAAQPIRIATSELPPFSMEHRRDEPGALFEMVEELARRTGLPATIEFVPWKRAVHLSTSRPRSAIFPLTRSPEREAQYRWLAPLYRENFVFVSLKGGTFDSAHPARSKHMRVGTLRGSLMIKYLHDHGYPNVVEAASIEEGLRFLRRGIVDAVCSDREIMRAALGARSEDDYLISATLRATTTWLGGSRDFTEADAARFDQAMKAMVDDGTYARLLKKYQLGLPQ